MLHASTHRHCSHGQRARWPARHRLHRPTLSSRPCTISVVAASAAHNALHLTPLNDLLQRTAIASKPSTEALGGAILARMPPTNLAGTSVGGSSELREAELVVEMARDRELVRAWLDGGAQDVPPRVLEGLNRVVAIQRSLVAQAAGPSQSPALIADPSLPLPAAADIPLLSPPSTSAPDSPSSPPSPSSPAGGASLDWVCPLGLAAGSSSRPVTRLRSLKQELGLLCFVLGASMRQLALAKVGIGPGSTDGAGGAAPGQGPQAPAPGGDMAARQSEAVALLRQAAGVFAFSQTCVLPGLGEELQAQALELQPLVAQLMSTLCLAEAQAVVIARASAKGSSEGTLASLEAGCWRLFTTAVELAGQVGVAQAPGSGIRLPFGLTIPRLGGGGSGRQSSGGSGQASDGAGAMTQLAWQLGSYVAASQAYHKAECRRLQGSAAFQDTEMGLATLLLTEAEAALSQAADATKGAPSSGKYWPAIWSAQVQSRQQAVAALKAESEKERLSVTLQPVPREVPPLPEPKVLVVPAAPFVPGLPPAS